MCVCKMLLIYVFNFDFGFHFICVFFVKDSQFIILC